ncbi:MAG: ABC transporter permease [Lachnospiraceae bacterium]|nr:ABC transporter permease [Lachnospiraceae bacterium]
MTDLYAIRKKLLKEQRQLLVHKFFKNRLAVTGGTITFVMLFLALLAPVLAPQGPLDMIVTDRLLAPSAAHPFGTDTFGRDVFTRILYGARVSMTIGFFVGLITMAAGMLLGLLASYFKLLDEILMRICDGLNAIPSTLLAIAFMSALGGSITNVIVSLSIVSIPRMARIARSAAVVVKGQTYIEAVSAAGASPLHIIFRHMAPNILSPVIVQASYVFANAIITEAALSFLGVGVPVPQPSWGNILYEGKDVIYNAWWMIVYPAVFTALTVFGLNLFGDGLRDLLDPHTS